MPINVVTVNVNGVRAAFRKGMAEWLEHYRRYWEKSFDRLEDYLRKVQKGNDDGKRN